MYIEQIDVKHLLLSQFENEIEVRTELSVCKKGLAPAILPAPLPEFFPICFCFKERFLNPEKISMVTVLESEWR